MKAFITSCIPDPNNPERIEPIEFTCQLPEPPSLVVEFPFDLITPPPPTYVAGCVLPTVNAVGIGNVNVQADISATDNDNCDWDLDLQISVPCNIPTVVSQSNAIYNSWAAPAIVTPVIEQQGPSGASNECDWTLDIKVDVPCVLPTTNVSAMGNIAYATLVAEKNSTAGDTCDWDLNLSISVPCNIPTATSQVAPTIPWKAPALVRPIITPIASTANECDWNIDVQVDIPCELPTVPAITTPPAKHVPANVQIGVTGEIEADTCKWALAVDVDVPCATVTTIDNPPSGSFRKAIANVKHTVTPPADNADTCDWSLETAVTVPCSEILPTIASTITGNLIKTKEFKAEFVDPLGENECDWKLTLTLDAPCLTVGGDTVTVTRFTGSSTETIQIAPAVSPTDCSITIVPVLTLRGGYTGTIEWYNNFIHSNQGILLTKNEANYIDGQLQEPIITTQYVITINTISYSGILSSTGTEDGCIVASVVTIDGVNIASPFNVTPVSP